MVSSVKILPDFIKQNMLDVASAMLPNGLIFLFSFLTQDFKIASLKIFLKIICSIFPFLFNQELKILIYAHLITRSGVTLRISTLFGDIFIFYMCISSE